MGGLPAAAYLISVLGRALRRQGRFFDFAYTGWDQRLSNGTFPEIFCMLFTERNTLLSTRPVRSCSHSHLAGYFSQGVSLLEWTYFSFHDPYFSDLVFDDIWDDCSLSLLCSNLDWRFSLLCVAYHIHGRTGLALSDCWEGWHSYFTGAVGVRNEWVGKEGGDNYGGYGWAVVRHTLCNYGRTGIGSTFESMKELFTYMNDALPTAKCREPQIDVTHIRK